MSQLLSEFHKLLDILAELFEKLKPVFDKKLPSPPSPYLPGVIEIVDFQGVGRVGILASWRELIFRQREMVRPRIPRGIQQASTPVSVGSIRPGSVAQTAGIETVGVLQLLARVFTAWNEVLNGGSAETFAATVAEEVDFMQQAERAGEAEIPSQAVTKSRPVTGGPGLMTTGARRPGRLSLGR